ncbi:hypothetical protein [Caballeronia sp. BR00000012568055]|uniref:hypothetical protein n=1 Tax=Caballeronia sp. BR00000012568055 TaxID=2918761 RepID=UPI0034D724C7
MITFGSLGYLSEPQRKFPRSIGSRHTSATNKTVYTVFSTRRRERMTTTPQIDPPTKKAFNFPKNGEGKATAKAESKTEVKAASKTSKKTQDRAVAASRPKSQSTGSGAGKKPATKSAAKTVSAKPAAKKAVKPAAKTAAPKTAAAETPAAKTKRVKKEKVVRDSFTMPKSDYAKIASIKQKCLDNGLRVKKSELLRAALSMLDAATDKRIVEAVKALEEVKTGRPANA